MMRNTCLFRFNSNISFLVLLFLLSNAMMATDLDPGDIVFTGYNADEGGSLGTDGGSFSFLLLKDLEAGTVIYFTDYGWTSANGGEFYTTSLSFEGVIKWTSTLAASCGDHIKITSNGVSASPTLTASQGTAANANITGLTTQNGITFNQSGDQIIAYQGSFSSPSFIAALMAEDGAFGTADPNNDRDSRLPTGLVVGTSAVAPAEQDNLEYNSTTINSTAISIQSAVNNSSNWSGNGTTVIVIGDISFTVSSCFVSALPLASSITSQTDNICNGDALGSLTVTATDGTTPYTYNWSNTATTATISTLGAGTYTVTVTDAGGTTATSSATITEPTALNTTISSQTNVACFGESTGSLTASVTGGTSPYTYNWNSGETSATISGKAAGTYTVSVLDANGCGEGPPP